MLNLQPLFVYSLLATVIAGALSSVFAQTVDWERKYPPYGIDSGGHAFLDVVFASTARRVDRRR